MEHREPYLHLRVLDRTDVAEAAALLGRGMADNPIHVSVYGDDEVTRIRRHASLMRVLLSSSPALTIDGVEQGGALVGVAAAAPPGRCQPRAVARLRLVTRGVTFGPRAAERLLTWNRAWAAHDISEPHVHLGPVSVDRHLRGRGIGTLLMLRHTTHLDSLGVAGYLETDRPEAVGFYERHGYAVIAEEEILGVPNWFMRRPPN
ncbi:GNAT family N-acetyltransferase [Microbacterium sp.]|jgi:GNAT superfamily N-acetyltransferase|uniref:GNAT family N-acetyltransferase n=2 Tax=Microbacterium sp. TaxID=51671 RepID=UPI002D1CE4C2|nr:GNAT family N-acetyltransferase [Microbacterium sp.]HWL77635.1 GNAT family N-acetyltransferase [Microbacterium sp.]